VADPLVPKHQQQKRFKSLQVKGIGDKSFENLSSYLTVSGKTTLTEKVRGPKSGKRAKTQPAPAAS
jgi:hypothetical protein